MFRVLKGGSQKNRLIETVLLSTHNIYFDGEFFFICKHPTGEGIFYEMAKISLDIYGNHLLAEDSHEISRLIHSENDEM